MDKLEPCCAGCVWDQDMPYCCSCEDASNFEPNCVYLKAQELEKECKDLQDKLSKLTINNARLINCNECEDQDCEKCLSLKMKRYKEKISRGEIALKIHYCAVCGSVANKYVYCDNAWYCNKCTC